MALLQARFTSSAWRLLCSTVCVHWATLPKAADQVDLLEGARAQDLGLDLAGQGDHRRAVHVGVPQPGEQIGGTGPAMDRQAAGRPVSLP